MDTSETNIKMCDCEEIQDGWQPSDGDWYLYRLSVIRQNPTVLIYRGSMGLDLDDTIWLPRQDELQEMVKKELNQLIFQFTDWLYAEDERRIVYDIKKEHHQFTSMEQLWLAFYMFLKYSKIWNGTEWIKK